MIKMNSSPYRYRYEARFVLEAATPLAIGSGDRDLLTDSKVLLDVNGLPYLPGTTIAGVVRHAIADIDPIGTEKYFGCQNGANGHGSTILFSEGRMIDAEGKVVDGIKAIDFADKFYKIYQSMPIRQHVRIGSTGTAEKMGKFDEQIVPKGTRFCCELEMLASKEQESKEFFMQVLSVIGDRTFRLGSGTRSGFGSMKVVKSWIACLDMHEKEDQEAYLSKSSELQISGQWTCWKSFVPESSFATQRQTIYKLQLHPIDFFHFSSGLGDKEVDNAPLTETFVKWTPENKAQVVHTRQILPASSLKGVISHRTAYYYNKLTGATIEQGTGKTGEENLAVKTLFGSSGMKDGETMSRGCVLLSDLIEAEPALVEHTFNHVSVSQFTGGAIAGHLYDEKALFGPEANFSTEIILLGSIDPIIIEAFEKAINDVCEGILPLGGMSNRGHGSFEGSFTKTIKEILQ